MKVNNIAMGINLTKVKVMFDSMLMITPVKGNLFKSIVTAVHPRNTAIAPILQVSSLMQSFCPSWVLLYSDTKQIDDI